MMRTGQFSGLGYEIAQKVEDRLITLRFLQHAARYCLQFLITALFLA